MAGAEFWTAGNLDELLRKDLQKAYGKVDRLDPASVLGVDPTVLITQIMSEAA